MRRRYQLEQRFKSLSPNNLQIPQVPVSTSLTVLNLSIYKPDSQSTQFISDFITRICLPRRRGVDASPRRRVVLLSLLLLRGPPTKIDHHRVRLLTNVFVQTFLKICPWMPFFSRRLIRKPWAEKGRGLESLAVLSAR